MKVSLQTLTQELLTFDVEDSTTVSYLKNMVSKNKVCDITDITLIHSGNILNDNNTMADCKIIEGSKIVMLIKKSYNMPKGNKKINNIIIPKKKPVECTYDMSSDSEEEETTTDTVNNSTTTSNSIPCIYRSTMPQIPSISHNINITDILSMLPLTFNLDETMMESEDYTVDLTSKDNDTITEIMEIMGCTKEEATAAYIKNHFNKELTVNYLLNGL